MGHVNEPGRRGRQGASSGAAEASQREQALDDWLDDISDDDWDATAHGIPRAASPVDQGVGVPEGDNWADPSVDRPAPTRFGARDEAHQAVVERRRIVAGLVVVVVVGLGVATSVLLLREGNETPVVTTIEPTTGTTQAPTETSPSDDHDHAQPEPPGDDHAGHGRRVHAPRGHQAPARRKRPYARARAPAGPVQCWVQPRCGRRNLRRTNGGGRGRVPGGERPLRRRSGRPRDRGGAEQRPRGRLTPGSRRLWSVVSSGLGEGQRPLEGGSSVPLADVEDTRSRVRP